MRSFEGLVLFQYTLYLWCADMQWQEVICVKIHFVSGRRLFKQGRLLYTITLTPGRLSSRGR